MIDAEKTVKTVENKPKPQWKPAKMLDTVKGIDWENFVPRWVDKDPGNVVKMEAEGWVRANALYGDRAMHVPPPSMLDGKPMSPSLTEYRELVLMLLPKDMADARKEYYDAVTDGTEENLKNKLQDDAAKMGGKIHGSIKTGTRVIE